MKQINITIKNNEGLPVLVKPAGQPEFVIHAGQEQHCIGSVFMMADYDESAAAERSEEVKDV